MPSDSSSTSESSGDEEAQKERRQRFAEAVDPNFSVAFGQKNDKPNTLALSSGGSKISSNSLRRQNDDIDGDDLPSISGFQKFVASKLDEILDQAIEYTETNRDFSSECERNRQNSPPLFHIKKIETEIRKNSKRIFDDDDLEISVPKNSKRNLDDGEEILLPENSKRISLDDDVESSVPKKKKKKKHKEKTEID